MIYYYEYKSASRLPKNVRYICSFLFGFIVSVGIGLFAFIIAAIL